MPAPVYTSLFAENNLTALKTAATGLLDGAICRLFSNNITPTKSTLLASYTEATFNGYAEIVVTWNAAVVNAGDFRQIFSQLLSWIAGAAPTPETIYGWYLVNTGGTEVIAAQRFDDEVEIVNEGDPVQALVTLQM